jgi:hypothetical protein
LEHLDRLASYGVLDAAEMGFRWDALKPVDWHPLAMNETQNGGVPSAFHGRHPGAEQPDNTFNGKIKRAI